MKQWMAGLGLALAVACSSESDAAKTYKTFAKAYMDGDMARAQSMATGAAAQRLTNMVSPPPGQPYVRPFKETVRQVHSVSFKVENESTAGDGVSLTMHVDRRSIGRARCRRAAARRRRSSTSRT